MFRYECIVIDEEGKTLKRKFEAESEIELLQKVKQNKLLLESYEQQRVDIKAIKKISIKELIVFCRQLSIMLQSGITVIKAIDILEQKSEKARTRSIYANVYESLQKGNNFASSLEDTGVFPLLLINMVQSGESGGVLEENMAKMADHYEKENKLRNKIRQASMYPMILGAVCMAVVILLMTVVMPQFLSMYENYTTLPWPTQFLMNLSNFFTDNSLLVIFIIGLFIVLSQMIIKIPSVRYKIDSFKLSMPIFGKLNRTIYSSRCARSFATLYASGVQMIDMINMTSRVINNKYVEKGFDYVVEKVTRGELVSTAIQDLNIFDPMFTSMVYIGEESGSLDHVLNKAADYFDEEADAATQKLISYLEPALILFMAFVIGFIIIAVMLPMYGSMDSIM